MTTSSLSSFDHGKRLALGIADHMEAMRDDIGAWQLGDPEFHYGYWSTEVDRCHKNRMHPDAIFAANATTSLRKAQASYNHLLALGGY